MMDADYFMYGLETWFDVTMWPRWMRRSFIVTLPISAPLYVCAATAIMVLAILWFLASVIVHAWR